MSSRRDLILELAKKCNREPNSSRDNTDTNSKAQVQNALLCDECLTESDEEPCELPLEQTTTLFEDSDDSVRDKDYIPEDLSSSESDEECNYKTAASQTSQALPPRSPSASPPRRSSPASPQGFLRRCSPALLESGLPGTLSSLESGLPDTLSSLESGLPLLRSQSGSPQNLSEQSNSTVLRGLPVNDSPSTETQMDRGVNKAGLPRKRMVISEPLIERKKRKLESEIAKLEIKPPCGEKCPKKCSYKFTPVHRDSINNMYRILNKESQGIFIKGMVDTKEVKTRRTSQRVNAKRSLSYAYHLKDSNDDRIEVCKTFFLSTLGYNAKNDCRVLNILKRHVDDQKDKRGKYTRENKIDRDIIKNPVLKYNPAISHYRREHAPKRLYLPSDINMTEMYKIFCETEPDTKVSIETYRHVIKKEMNISFAHLGNEECELCALFQEHNKDHIESQDQTCDTCKQYLSHKNNYTTSRINYKFDAENSANETDTKYYSVDLQKVIMLPRMEQYKAAIFCSRIIAFNESFVPLGKSSKNFPVAVLWNETVSGRSSHDILSAYRTLFLQNRDTEKIVLWADNCSSQNKNWALLSFLLNIINSDLIATNTIEIKYFEPGHTFMSADQFHHQVETKLRNTKVYDFDDYVARVKSVNSMKTIVKEMNFTDFYKYDECVSQHKIRNSSPRIYLKDITHVKAERGYFTLKFKKDQDDEDFQILDFLQNNKVLKNKTFPELRPKAAPRGITEEKKKEILEKLVPLMPENRRVFWLNIPTSNASDFED